MHWHGVKCSATTSCTFLLTKYLQRNQTLYKSTTFNKNIQFLPCRVKINCKNQWPTFQAIWWQTKVRSKRWLRVVFIRQSLMLVTSNCNAQLHAHARWVLMPVLCRFIKHKHLCVHYFWCLNVSVQTENILTLSLSLPLPSLSRMHKKKQITLLITSFSIYQKSCG